MSSWLPTWLPTLPSIDLSLPSGIQKRFLSFALRQALGHFLKPGQLDTQQVDSQIGSGFVQVRDVELDNQAINTLIAGLPIQLHDGSVGKVTARIPWPNPLTAAIGISLESLHLTFNLTPTTSKGGIIPVDLAESVASVAETFIHDELDAEEEATLFESIHPDLSASSASLDHVPGGLDPFIMDEGTRSDSDPTGVSIFATLIERLLARFQFDATDVKITLVHPDHASFTICVPEIRYATEEKAGTPGSAAVDNQGQPAPRVSVEGTTRTVTVRGITVTTRCLRTASPPVVASPVLSGSPITPRRENGSPEQTLAPAYSPPASPQLSDSSDIDEETHLMMSQSLVGLPPRPPSPTSSVASSMYQSAISITQSGTHSPPMFGSPTGTVEVETGRITPTSPLPPLSLPPRVVPEPLVPPAPIPASPPAARRTLGLVTSEIQDETILSFGSDPISMRLITPNAVRRTVQEGPSSSAETRHPGSRAKPASVDSPAVRLDISIGVVALALRARHVRSLLEMAQLWTSHSPAVIQSSVRDANKTSPPFLDRLDAEVRLRAFVGILLPAKTASMNEGVDPVSSFFDHPLSPPRLAHGYVRIHLDTLHTSVSMRPSSEYAANRKRPQNPDTSITASLSLSELSIFAFLPHPTDGPDAELIASPLLVTDPNLPTQYSQTHVQPDLRQPQSPAYLPAFDVIDWTDPAQFNNAAKVSLWRTRAGQGGKFAGQGLPSSPPPFHSPLRNSPLRTPSSPRQGGAALSASPGGRGDLHTRQTLPAVSVKFTMTSRHSVVKSSRSKGKTPESHISIEVDIAPLHAFCDLALVLTNSPSGTNEVLLFVQELSTAEPMELTDRASYDESDSEDDDDEDTPPATPLATSPFSAHRNKREQEQERKRLERLVLEDLDLGYDYSASTSQPVASQYPSKVEAWHKKRRRSHKTQHMDLTVVLPMIRVDVRASPHPIDSRRSGAVVLDIHDLRLFPGGPPSVRKHTTRFADPGGPVDLEGFPTIRQDVEDALLFGECERLVLSYSLPGTTRATALFSLGAAAPEPEQRGWTGSPPTAIRPSARLRPQFTVSKALSQPSPSAQELTTLTATIDVPAVFVRLNKPVLDGLQLWADDLTQMIENASRSSSTEQEKVGSRDASLIGSRFFTKTRKSQDSGTDSASVVSAQRTSANTETILKVFVSDVAGRLDVPRQGIEEAYSRPFDVIASNIDVLLEINPEGKDETVLTLGVAELDVLEWSEEGSASQFLGFTRPYAMSSSGQSLFKLRFVSLTIPETSAKESRVKVTLSGVTYTLYPTLDWAAELGQFFKAPPGAFESVVPSERTRVSVTLVDSSIRTLAPSHPGGMVLYLGELDFSTVMVGNSPEAEFHIMTQRTSLWLHENVGNIDAEGIQGHLARSQRSLHGAFWKALGYALVSELDGLDLRVYKRQDVVPADVRITANGADLRLHLCADTGGVLGAFIGSFSSIFATPSDSPALATSKRRVSTEVASPLPKRDLLASLDESAFKRKIPEVGPAPDFINDDLPSNPDYLDESFGAAGGLMALDDQDLDDDFGEDYPVSYDQTGVIARYGGETIRLLDPKGLNIIENYFESLPPDSADEMTQYGDTTFRVRLYDCHVTVLLYDGYDWARTRHIIEEQAKEMRRKLAKIRQLVASGQTPDPSVEETNTTLFNSVYIGLEHNIDELEPGALIAAIDEQLNEDLETASQSSWQSLKPQQLSPGGHNPSTPSKRSRKKLTRSKGPCVEFRLQHLDANIDNFRTDPELASRTLVTVRDVEILDHIRTSTWSKFLTSLSADSKGNIRETESNMVRVELRKVYPVPGDPTEEARLRAKLLPLRLYVDQDALDFMKKFFSFSDPDVAPASTAEPSEEIFFQHVEVFPVDLKLDYKPRRVDYRALRSGRTIELMNFFHFDGAEMTLRHITLTGITGWARVGDLLNDLWTPDVKATQLVEVISGVAPIRSVVNVGSGVADLVLLPIAQYKKDGRVIRGLQKGTTAFVQSTAIEAIKLGARLATGTQVILEQAEHVIGGQFTDPVTAEAVQLPMDEGQEDAGDDELISRYAEQPMNMKEGVRSAVRSLRRNLNSAAQTILAVPMEVYERSGNEGAVRAVVRAVPIAVLKPMIGASEAVSKTLMGIHNSLDPSIRAENEAKYKHR